MMSETVAVVEASSPSNIPSTSSQDQTQLSDALGFENLNLISQSHDFNLNFLLMHTLSLFSPITISPSGPIATAQPEN